MMTETIDSMGSVGVCPQKNSKTERLYQVWQKAFLQNFFLIAAIGQDMDDSNLLFKLF